MTDTELKEGLKTLSKRNIEGISHDEMCRILVREFNDFPSSATYRRWIGGVDTESITTEHKRFMKKKLKERGVAQ